MSTQALLVEVLLSAFFAIACFRARSGSSDVRGLAPKRLFVLTDRIERLRVSRWQWCSMVVLLLLVRMQHGAPMVAELTVLSQFIVFLALPSQKSFAAKASIAKALTGGSSPLMKELLHAADFLGRVRRRLRFGALSREPLLLLRFEWKGDSVECDWLMRPPDQWDKDLPAHLAKENQTLQALRDALSLREVIFESFPAVINAELRMFRADAEHRLELVMTGKVNRYNDAFERVASVAMRAKLCGFHFTLEAGEMESTDFGLAELLVICLGRLRALDGSILPRSGGQLWLVGGLFSKRSLQSGFQT